MNYARSINQENLLLLNSNQLAFFARPQALPPVCACDHRGGRASRHGFPGRAGEPVDQLKLGTGKAPPQDIATNTGQTGNGRLESSTIQFGKEFLTVHRPLQASLACITQLV